MLKSNQIQSYGKLPIFLDSARDRLRGAKYALTDFDRTLLQLFDNEALKNVTDTLKRLYLDADIGGFDFNKYQDPYSLWTNVYRHLRNTAKHDVVFQIQRRASTLLAHYECEAAATRHFFPRVRQTLEWFKSRHVPCAIVSTNAPEAIMAALQVNDALSFFAVVQGREDESSPDKLKPNPNPLIEALQKLHGTPEEAFFVGDSQDDAISARLAGVLAVNVLTGERTVEELIDAGARVVISDFSALQDL